MKKISTLRILLFTLIGLLVISAAYIAGSQKQLVPIQGTVIPLTTLEPAKAALLRLGGYLPKLGSLFLILVVGVLVAVGVAALVNWFLKVIRLDTGAQKIGIPGIFKKGNIGLSLKELLTEIVFFLIIIGTLITALEFYGLTTTPIISRFLSYLPQVMAAIFVLILGILLAVFSAGIVTLVAGNVKIAQAKTLGNIAKYAISVVAGLLALNILGLGVILTDKSKDIILGGLVFGLAIAFGLGLQDKVGEILDKVFKK